MTSPGQKRLPRNSWKNPVILVDRCFSPTFAESLRKYGVNAYHLGEVYPRGGKEVPDTEWIKDAGEKGYIVFTRDIRVQRNTIEFQAIQEHRAKVFAITARQASKETIGLYFGRQMPNIVRRGLSPGPALWRVRGDLDTVRVLP